jgi:hypothetical protein
MATTTSSIALVPVVPVFTNTERLALAGFLAGYSGLTRQAYELDLRQFASWCQQHQLRLFQARRADIEFFARDLEARGRARPLSRGGCAPSPASTSTPSRKNSSNTRPPRTSGDHAWTTSPTPPGWTATNSVRCWSPPGWGRLPSMR